MTPLIRTFRPLLLAVLALTAVSLARPGTAVAACFAAPAGTRVVPQRAPSAPAGSARVLTVADQGSSPSPVVGMWHTLFLLGNGPDRYDESLQQFHADGTEMMLSNGLPPALGNVCVGIWKHTGGRSLKVKHMAWNWEANGTFAGTFIMEIELRVSGDGRTFEGSWTADSYDPAGDVIPAMHAEGVTRGRRISVD